MSDPITVRPIPSTDKGVVWSLQPPSTISASMQKAVSDTLAAIPPSGHTAFVAVATEKGANVVVAHRFNQHWAAAGWVGKSGWDGAPIEAGAKLVAVF